MIVIMHWCANLHDPRHKYVVLKGVGIALRIFVELIQDVGAFPVHILPLFHWLRHHLHASPYVNWFSTASDATLRDCEFADLACER